MKALKAVEQQASRQDGDGEIDVDEYFANVARARYVLRSTFRLFGEAARSAGLEPLQHQALIQIAGAVAGGATLSVRRIAERLDVTPAFASRLIRDLKSMGLVARQPSDGDRRLSLVDASPEGRSLLTQISESVHVHMTYFQSQLSSEERASALSVVAFYVGVPLHEENLSVIDGLVESAIAAIRR